ncbi:MAG: hypothetical protein ACM3UL_02675 [Ignavibacteria bacterium]
MIELQTKKTRFATTNIALIGIFSALWVALNLTVAPIGFTLTHLPTIHSAIIFVTLLLVAWATRQYGAASLVGVIGSAIVVLAGGPLPVLGFVPAALIFDLILFLSHHRVDLKPFDVGVSVLACIICGYVAAIVNGFFILSLQPAFALTVWGGWNILGAVIGFAIALPIVAALEKAEVRKVKVE